MERKAKKYITYVIRFAKSKHKKQVIKDLAAEIKKKGPVTGIKSLLHKKSHYYFGEVDDHYHVDSIDLAGLSIQQYDRNKKVVLPLVTRPKVSIIVPSYNQVEFTYNCLHSVFEHAGYNDYEIILADDRSTEDTTILRENFENIVFILNPVNLGFLRNCNNAATKARGEYLVFLNNDTQVQENWLAELLYIFEHNKDAGLVGSKLVYPDGRLQEAGGIIWRDGSGQNYGNTGNPLNPRYNYVKEADYISGASVMISKKLWDEIGGFDELYLPAYCEDSDLCFKVRQKGYKVIYQPFSQVIHFEGVTHGTDTSAGIKAYQVINQEKFRKKWEEELKLKSKKGQHVFYERDRTANQKHVLVIDHYLPQIDKDAGSRTISNFIDVLLELGYSVKFMGENSGAGTTYQKHFQQKGVEVLYGSQFDFNLKRWRQYLKENMSYLDAIVLSRSSVCKPILAFLCQQRFSGRTIYYGHDLGYLRLEKEGLLKRDDSLLKMAKKIKGDEDFMYQHASDSLAISSEEIAYLHKYITKPIHYVPPYFFNVQDNTAAYESRAGILFVGGFNHPPNQDAMRWFLDNVYAGLEAQGIYLTIAGSKMPEFIFNHRERFSSLSVLPDVSVEELEALYTRTRIAIAPLQSGAGVKGKVIESMAKGVPVVGTDVAFEGMPKDDGFIYKGVNTQADMLTEIIRVYTDKNQWQKLSIFGKAYVAGNFNMENMKAVFKKIIG